MGAKHGTPIERVLRRVVVNDDGCHVFTGALRRDGYGEINVARRTTLAYRVVYEHAMGPIPQGMTIDHLCRNRACVNPAHMEIITRAENVLRGQSPPAINARKTHCPNGHAYDTIRPNGYRRCGVCDLARRRQQYAERKAQACAA